MTKRLIISFISVLFILVLSGPAEMVLAETPDVVDDPRISQIDYHFVGHLEKTDDDGRVLVWEAKIDGAFSGTMKWWFVDPPPAPDANFVGGNLGYYSARWEIWSENELLLAGASAGKTVFQNGADGVWDGHGVVTEARPEFITLVGNKIYETGPVVVGPNPPMSYSGSGLFVVY